MTPGGADPSTPIVTTDGDGCILSANAAAARATGRSLARDLPLRELLPARLHPHWGEFLAYARTADTLLKGMPLLISVQASDGREVEVEVYVHGDMGGEAPFAAFGARASMLI